MRVFGVKKAIFDKYRCGICFKGTEALAKKLHKKPYDQEDIDKYMKHQEHVVHSSKVFRDVRDNLKSDEVLYVYDYTTHHATATFTLKNLNVTEYYRDEMGELCWHFNDFFSTSKKDYQYTHTVFSIVQQSERFKNARKIYLWSDGGLKTKENLYYLSKIAKGGETKKEMVVCFFPPYHGLFLSSAGTSSLFWQVTRFVMVISVFQSRCFEGELEVEFFAKTTWGQS